MQYLRHEVLLRGKSTPSVIACGDATFPKGTALAVAGNFAAAPEGVPWGELAANTVSRLRGYKWRSTKSPGDRMVAGAFRRFRDCLFTVSCN